MNKSEILKLIKEKKWFSIKYAENSNHKLNNVSLNEVITELKYQKNYWVKIDKQFDFALYSKVLSDAVVMLDGLLNEKYSDSDVTSDYNLAIKFNNYFNSSTKEFIVRKRSTYDFQIEGTATVFFTGS